MKSHIELAISEKEYKALQAVMTGLHNGTFKHGTGHNPKDNSPLFNMTSFSCGTAGCIGGWVGVLINGGTIDGGTMRIMEETVTQYGFKHMDNHGLMDLYYPGTETLYHHITPDEAAEAIYNYLTTGDSDWWGVLGEERPVYKPDFYDQYDVEL